MNESSGNLLSDLREGTNSEHRRVETHALLRTLMAPALSLEQYAGVISAFAGFYAALEPQVMEMSSRFELHGYRYQPRLPLLIKDREVLPVCPVTPCKAAPGHCHGDELVGVLYVLEGATQGGLVIAPWLRHRLGLSERTGASFFNLYRQRSWEKFRAVVGRDPQHYDSSLAVTAARATFDHLYAHLDLCLCGASNQSSERNHQQ